MYLAFVVFSEGRSELVLRPFFRNHTRPVSKALTTRCLCGVMGLKVTLQVETSVKQTSFIGVNEYGGFNHSGVFPMLVSD